jgi:hypothetical protein
MMHLVYECAVLLISAARANQSTQGLFMQVDSDDSGTPPFRIWYQCPDDVVDSVILYNDSYIRPYKAIHQRGWTMQEHILSSRMLVYSSTRIRWYRTTIEFDGPLEGQVKQDNAEKIPMDLHTNIWQEIFSMHSSPSEMPI